MRSDSDNRKSSTTAKLAPIMGYDVCIWKEGTEPEPGKLYIYKLSDTSIQCAFKNSNNKTITTTIADIAIPDELTLKNIKPHLPTILETISKQKKALIIEREAALILQEQWREKKASREKSKLTKEHVDKEKSKSPKEHSDLPEIIKFYRKIQFNRPQIKDIAEKTNNGKWLELNFDDPNFISDSFTTRDSGAINIDDQVTAQFLHNALIEFRETIEDYKDSKKSPKMHMFSFDDQFSLSSHSDPLLPNCFPYDPRTITYATEQNIRTFQDNLKKLNKTDRCYFTVDFSKEREIAFFFLGLLSIPDPNSTSENFYFNALDKWTKINCRNNPETLKEKLLTIAEFKNSNQEKRNGLFERMLSLLKSSDFSAKIVDKLVSIKKKLDEASIEEQKSIFKEATHGKSFNNAMLLQAGLRLNEQLPSVVISPNDNSAISMCILNMKSFRALLQAMHGDDAVDLHFIAGKFSPRFVKNLDKNKNPARPIEFIYPTSEKHDTPHYITTDDFMLSWHDLLHTWRSSCNMHKSFIRCIRDVLESKGFPLSKLIYEFTDLDYQTHHLRTRNTPFFSAPKEEHDLFKINIIYQLISPTWRQNNEQIWSSNLVTGDYLLLLIDFIKNKSKWTEKENFGEDPQEFIVKNLPPPADKERFRKQFVDMNEIISTHPGKSPEYYILQYRLMPLIDEKLEVTSLCEQVAPSSLDQKYPKDTLLKWDRNEGLYYELLNPNASTSNMHFIAGEDPKAIFDNLLEIIKHTPTKVSFRSTS